MDASPAPAPTDSAYALDPELVRGRLRRSLLLPDSLRLPCVDHHAEAGQPCWVLPRAVCWSRITRSQVAERSARALDPKTGPKPNYPHWGRTS